MSSKEYQRQWYLDNAERIKAKSSARRLRVRQENREYVQTLKNTTPCADCGQLYPYYVMQFDHLGIDKERNVSQAVHAGWAMERLQREIDKCEIVCSNCHAERSHQRR